MTKWISENLPWIVTTLAGALMGFVAGQVKVTAIERRLEVLESQHLEQRLCRVEAIEGIGDCKR